MNKTINTLLSRHWFCPVIYQSEGVTRRDLEKFYDEVDKSERLVEKVSD